MSRPGDNPTTWVSKQRVTGTCTTCGAPAEPFRMMCTDHRRKTRRAYANRLEGSSRCMVCGVRQRTAGTQSCTRCRHGAKARARIRYRLMKDCGLCTTCGFKSGGKSKCRTCSYKDNTNRRERRLHNLPERLTQIVA